MTHVVIVGAGIGGVPAAYAMRAGLDSQDRVSVVSDKDYFHFVPSNPWVAMGWRNFEEIAFPVAPYLAQRGISFIPHALKRVDAELNQIELADGSRVDYDYLILATGLQGVFDEVLGLDPKAGNTHSVIHVEDAQRANTGWQAFVREPGPVVVGAAQGSAILGPMYEFAFLADADLRDRKIRDRVPITVITPEPYAGHLGLGGKGETRQLLEAALRERDITCVCNARTLGVESGKVHIVEYDQEGREQTPRELPFAYSVYWPPFGGAAALKNSLDLTDARGFVPVDEYLRCPEYSNIFAVGACVARPPVDATPVTLGVPESVYSIQGEVDTAVGNILADINGEGPTSAAPRRAKWLSDMGESGAQYLSEPNVPLRNINWMKEGRWVHTAKVDFEKYFISKIKLQPTGRRAPTGSEVATLVYRMESEKLDGRSKPHARHGTAGDLTLALEQERARELNALAEVLCRPAEVLAAELLKAAVHDAYACLSAPVLEQVELARRELLLAELPERQPGVEFDSGAT
jgi:sulfide:quinone oxidoreductase